MIFKRVLLAAAVGFGITVPTVAIAENKAAGIVLPSISDTSARHGHRRGGHYGYRRHRGPRVGLSIGIGIGRPAYRGYDYADRYYGYGDRYYVRRPSVVYVRPAPIVVAPPRRVVRSGLSRSHVSWCYDRYRTYREWDNTYKPTVHTRAECRSPWY